MNVLVTGGAGFIGSHVAKALSRAGHVPVVFDSLHNGKQEAVLWGEMIKGDVRDTAQLSEVIRTNGIEAVIHLAGLIEVGESVKDPLSFYETNTAGSLSVARAMLANGVKYLVFSSTAAVYGSPVSEYLKEDHITQPVNPYGWSKLAAERIFLEASATGGLRVVPLRYFNAAGADPEGELGENHNPETHLIPRACLAVKGDIPALTVFGDDWSTPDGTCVRDYVHVTDLASAHIKALEYLVKGGESRPFNLGTGKGYSVREIIAAVSEAAHLPVPHAFAARREGDPAVLVADSGDAKAILGWQPEHSSLKELCTTAWKWFSRVE
ncbi:MAG TPA: UDP-glucose 4-epimerase GalE [Verrucomicrobiae bacterium]|nr:UDP-glucose 4-epimerase GalE [Verrucomicrobiae bacterium]